MVRMRSSIIGNSPAFLKVMSSLPALAFSDAPIMVLGETGTGKELIAQEIHQHSPRAKNVFFPLNCGAIPNELFESELFGSAKGAFTDAKVEKPGILQGIDGGTLFLDEIDCIDFNTQTKLLRFIQEGEFRPVGYCRNIKSDIRIIAATNADLGQKIADKEFREDLFYRLNVLNITLPPLRERIEDIPLLANYFLEKFSSKYQKVNISLAPETILSFISYNWPGNIRELEGVLERAILTASSTRIQPQDLGFSVQTDEKTSDLSPYYAARNGVLDRFERSYLLATLKAYSGNVSRAANGAGVDRRILQRLLRKHQIERAEFSDRKPATAIDFH